MECFTTAKHRRPCLPPKRICLFTTVIRVSHLPQPTVELCLLTCSRSPSGYNNVFQSKHQREWVYEKRRKTKGAILPRSQLYLDFERWMVPVVPRSRGRRHDRSAHCARPPTLPDDLPNFEPPRATQSPIEDAQRPSSLRRFKRGKTTYVLLIVKDLKARPQKYIKYGGNRQKKQRTSLTL